MTDPLASYIRDLFYMFREAAADARRKAGPTKEDLFQAGREMAYVEALLLMQTQASAFMLDASEIGMAGFDPLRDPLDPPESQPTG